MVETSKKQQIIEIKAKQPDLGPTEIARMTKSHPKYVSNTLSEARKAGSIPLTSSRVSRMAKPRAGSRSRNESSVKETQVSKDKSSTSPLEQAKQFVQNVGGFEQALELIGQLQQLQL